jgi:hypothetical protein
MVTTKTTTTVVSITATYAYSDVPSGTFNCSILEVDDVTAAFYQLDGSDIRSGSVYIDDGTSNETIRIIEVDGSDIYVEELVNSYTASDSIVRFLGFDDASDTGVLAKNSSGLYLYPSRNKADQGINKDRYDIYTLNLEANDVQLPLYAMSRQCLIKRDLDNAGIIYIEGSTDAPILYARENRVFIEDNTKTLNLSSEDDGFYAIYIQEDDSDTPVIEGTYPAELFHKAVLTPLDTLTYSSKYCIGWVYVYSGNIIGVHNLENDLKPVTYSYVDHNFEYEFGDENYTFNMEKTLFVPVFFDSVIDFRFSGKVQSDLTDADYLDVYFAIQKDGSDSEIHGDHRIRERWSGGTKWFHHAYFIGSFECTAGLHYFRFGGKAIGYDDDDNMQGKSSFNIYSLHGRMEVTPLSNATYFSQLISS